MNTNEIKPVKAWATYRRGKMDAVAFKREDFDEDEKPIEVEIRPVPTNKQPSLAENAEVKLKPCPFCGEQLRGRQGEYQVLWEHRDVTDKCPASTLVLTSDEFEAWNTRATDNQEKGSANLSGMKDLRDRIQNYLENGGFFNPEMMEHNKVRDLLMDIRDYLTTVMNGSANPSAECEWDGGEYYFQTDCGHAFEFNYDGIKENGFKFCPFCGNPIRSAMKQQKEI